ncbi:MAG TPA: hypothetical protein VHW23_06150 [Kofleriaceae bacterium]|nr:hypothetical protein [Kofleriaceae bacterium]
MALLIATGAAIPASADIALSLYGDVDGGLQTTGTRTGTADGFSAAKLELFTTANAGNWSFLAETLFEAGDDNEFGIDVERIQVNYLYREWLRLAAGRFHTAIGYYNDGFHHGAFFMPGVARPQVVQFEDDGGLIPAHSVGVHADGRFALGDSKLRYDLDLGNGRAADRETVQVNHDTNRPKSFNVRLRFEPSGALDGLIVGGNLYVDGIPARMATDGGPGPLGALREWLAGVHAAYFEHELHVVIEAYAIDHAELDTGVSHWTYAGFAELGKSYGKLLPFVRYEYTRYPAEGDPYYERTAGDGYQAFTAGVKHATSDNIALKAQAGAVVSHASNTDTLFTLTGQIAFAF